MQNTVLYSVSFDWTFLVYQQKTIETLTTEMVSTPKRPNLLMVAKPIIDLLAGNAAEGQFTVKDLPQQHAAM